MKKLSIEDKAVAARIMKKSGLSEVAPIGVSYKVEVDFENIGGWEAICSVEVWAIKGSARAFVGHGAYCYSSK